MNVGYKREGDERDLLADELELHITPGDIDLESRPIFKWGQLVWYRFPEGGVRDVHIYGFNKATGEYRIELDGKYSWAKASVLEPVPHPDFLVNPKHYVATPFGPAGTYSEKNIKKRKTHAQSIEDDEDQFWTNVLEDGKYYIMSGKYNFKSMKIIIQRLYEATDNGKYNRDNRAEVIRTIFRGTDLVDREYILMLVILLCTSNEKDVNTIRNEFQNNNENIDVDPTAANLDNILQSIYTHFSEQITEHDGLQFDKWEPWNGVYGGKRKRKKRTKKRTKKHTKKRTKKRKKRTKRR